MKDKIELIKTKLRKQAIEAQKLIDRASDAGDFEKVAEIQEQNVKVFTLLGITPQDGNSVKCRLNKNRLSRESLTEEKSSTFITLEN